MTPERIDVERAERELNRVRADPDALLQIAENLPQYRAAVAVHPAAFPELVEYLSEDADPTVVAALESRQARGPATLAKFRAREEPRPEPVSPPLPPGLSAYELQEVPAASDDEVRAELDVGNLDTGPARLAEIAERYPDLRPDVALHPEAYPGLLAWLADLRDPAIVVALRRRGDGDAGRGATLGRPQVVDRVAVTPAPGAEIDGVCLAAFVLSILGGSLLAVILGAVGMSRTKWNGLRGRNLGLAAVIIGLAMSVVWLGLLVFVSAAAR